MEAQSLWNLTSIAPPSQQARVERASAKAVKATSYGAPIPHNLALLDDSNTIRNDPRINASHICAITPKGLVNLELP
jgi:hypothetical protein